VADRLFEGEEAVLHVIERIVAPLWNRANPALPGTDQISKNPFSWLPDSP
jgi:hypothetical protein